MWEDKLHGREPEMVRKTGAEGHEEDDALHKVFSCQKDEGGYMLRSIFQLLKVIEYY